MNQDNSDDDGSTTIDQRVPTKETYGQSSPNVPHGSPHPSFPPYMYGANPYGFTYPPGFPMGPDHRTFYPMYDAPLQGFPPAHQMPVNLPSGHPTSYPMLGVNPYFQGYNPYGYPYPMAFMSPSPLMNPSTSDKVNLHQDDYSHAPQDTSGPPPVQHPSFPKPIQIYYSPKLQTVSTKADFNTWMRDFISVLKTYKLEDILPGPRGQSICSASPSERQNIIATLYFYVKDEFLPTCFFETTDNIYESVRRAIQLQ